MRHPIVFAGLYLIWLLCEVTTARAERGRVDTQLFGSMLKTFKTGSAEKCLVTCESYDDCSGFNYTIDAQKNGTDDCELMTGDLKENQSKGVISCLRKCASSTSQATGNPFVVDEGLARRNDIDLGPSPRSGGQEPSMSPAFTVLGSSPTAGEVGSLVTVWGRNFDKVSQVYFLWGTSGAREGENVINDSVGTLQVRVPRGCRGTAPITVAGNGISAETPAFECYEPISMSNAQPEHVRPGDTITIFGTGLYRVTSISANWIGQLAVGPVNGQGTTLQVTVPRYLLDQDQTTNLVMTVSPQNAVARVPFSTTILSIPELNQVQGQFGLPGQSVNLIGRFCNSPNQRVSVMFNGVPGQVQNCNASWISVAIPNASSGPMWVERNGVRSEQSFEFHIGIPGEPVIDRIEPAAARPGDTVVVEGRNLISSYAVVLGGTVVPPSNTYPVTDARIRVTVPQGVSSGPVGVATFLGCDTRIVCPQARTIVSNVQFEVLH